MKTQNYFEVVVVILSLTIFIFSSGCNKNDLIVNTEISDINGIVVDANNNPVNNVNVELIILNDFIVTKTLSDGRFHFSNVALPYRLNLTTGHNSNYNKNAYIYDGLREKNPKIKITDIMSISVNKNSLVHLKTPDSVYMNNKSYVVAVYDTTGKIFNYSEIDNVYENDFNIYWQNENDNFIADIFMISKEGSYYNGYYFYDYFEKKTKISNGGIDTVKFDYSEVKKVDVNRNVVFFNSADWEISDIYTGFTFNESLLNSYKGIAINRLGQDGQRVIYPVINGKKLYYYLSIRFYKSDNSYYYWSGRFFLMSTFYPNIKPIPSLVNPPNNYEFVNSNTHFSINDADNTGVYLYTIKCYNINSTISLYTKNASFYYPHIKDTSFVLKKNMDYYWFVSKYYNTENTDMLLSDKLNISTNPIEIGSTGRYYFKTRDTL
jgi:hypothetical protein